MPEFIHLHCHTEYSLLDGAIRIKDLCKRAKDYGMNAAAITDHGNLFGALDFYTTAKEFGIKPIIGCEVYVAHSSRHDKESKHAKTRYHLILLAQNITGYKNLLKLVTLGFTEGYYYKPRVDKEILQKYNEGIIALSACLAGEIPRILMDDYKEGEQNSEEFGEGTPDKGGMDAAIEMAEIYSKIFPGRFYLELQENGLEKQKILNSHLIKLADRTGLPLVATNDCHYLDKDDVEAHDILLCIQTQNTINDKNRMRFETRELYYKTPEEMEQAFSHIPQALENTLLIADQCDLDLDLKNYHFPKYEPDSGNSLETELKTMAEAGLKERIENSTYKIDPTAYKERLEKELKVICDMGFAGYFLIVQDFINWAKKQNIPVGPGRGSAAGSLAAWALKITDLDPIPYNLLFEVFLNSERISIPDIDVDFCKRRRGEVIAYVAQKYGENSVAQITTFGKMKARAVVRDVGRALGMSYAETDRIAKLIPEDPKMTIDKAMDDEPELKNLYISDKNIKKLIDISKKLEGLNRHASTHAAGVVISDKPMVEYLPLYRGKNNEIVSQFDMKMVEKTGLVKFDFLGLRTMTLIQYTLDLIKATGEKVPDMSILPLDDPKVYELYSRGDTTGIFQVESEGMRSYLKMLHPTVFEDLIAMLALYRPGPLNSGMVDEFIKRKHGEVEVNYPLPQLEECLKDTYGVIVYQEQLMQIARIVAGYSLGQADLLRRAMGKKKIEEMAKQRINFVKGAKQNDVDEKKANEIFDLMEKFAAFGFNKSNSAAYALLSYFTAYLKVHYPVEFMAALLTSEMDNDNKRQSYINNCKDEKIKVLPPDIQLAGWNFSVHNNAIVCGLGCIKNLGEKAVEQLAAEREKNGPFVSLLDLCIRLDSRLLNKQTLENMIKGGAFDCWGVSRSSLFNNLNVILRAKRKVKDKSSYQTSLFSMISETKTIIPGLDFTVPELGIEKWSDEQKLLFEKEALGFYLSGHPLEGYRQDFSRLNTISIEDAKEYNSGCKIKMAVFITSLNQHTDSKGRQMAFCQMEDLSGSGECIFFPKEYTIYKDLLEKEKYLLIQGKLDLNQSENNAYDMEEGKELPSKKIKIIVNEASLLAEACLNCKEPVSLNLTHLSVNQRIIDQFIKLLEKFPGKAPVCTCFEEDGIKYTLDMKYRVGTCPDFYKELDTIKKSIHPQTYPVSMTCKKDIKIFIKGICLSTKSGGWAAILCHKDDERIIKGGFAFTTPPRMEITACLEALKSLKEPCNVTIVTKSKDIKRRIEDIWLPLLQVCIENNDLWEELLPFLKKHKVCVELINTEQKYSEIERCYNLAKEQAARENLPRDPGKVNDREKKKPKGKSSDQNSLFSLIP